MKTPVLITFDVDPGNNIEKSIDVSLNLLKDIKIKATFFFTASILNKTLAKKVLSAGHEIGCHGLTHNDKEEFNKLSLTNQYSIIDKATSLIEDLSGIKPKSFRAPRVKTNAHTLQVLEKLGYTAESSICSQRMDLVSSNLINFGWLVAPRKPYHPDKINPFRRGKMKILEVPVSAMILPFISTTLRLIGLPLMKLFFNILALEYRITGKPIVYLIHPTEFTLKKARIEKDMLVPSKKWLIHGLPLRFLLIESDSKKIFKLNRNLFKYIAKKSKFMTMNEYTERF